MNIDKAISEVTIERVNIDYIKTGLKLCYAINWNLQNMLVQYVNPEFEPGDDIYGVWIDTVTEGCIFNGIFSLGGEHCWRIARTINAATDDRGPSENHFYSCIGDNGTVSCICISSLHRGIFTNCWCSTQRHRDQDAAVVMVTIYGEYSGSLRRL